MTDTDTRPSITGEHITIDNFDPSYLPLMGSAYKDLSPADIEAIKAHKPGEDREELTLEERERHDYLTGGKVWLRLQDSELGQSPDLAHSIALMRASAPDDIRHYYVFLALHPTADPISFKDWLATLDTLAKSELPVATPPVAGESTAAVREYFVTARATLDYPRQDLEGEVDVGGVGGKVAVFEKALSSEGKPPVSDGQEGSGKEDGKVGDLGRI